MAIEQKNMWISIINDLGITDKKHVNLLCEYCHLHAKLENEMNILSGYTSNNLLPMSLNILSKIDLDKVEFNNEIKTSRLLETTFTSIDLYNEKIEDFIVTNIINVLN